MRAPFNAESHPQNDLHWPILNKKVALVPKRATMHTLGIYTCHLCYIRTATLLNLLHIQPATHSPFCCQRLAGTHRRGIQDQMGRICPKFSAEEWHAEQRKHRRCAGELIGEYETVMCDPFEKRVDIYGRWIHSAGYSYTERRF